MKKIVDVEGIEFCSINEKTELHKKKKSIRNSSKYTFFRNTIGFLAKSKKNTEIINPPYRVLIKSRSMLDIDNSIKPILDGLQDAEVLKNDALVRDLRIIHNRGTRTFLKVFVSNIDDYRVRTDSKCCLSDEELILKCRGIVHQMCQADGKSWKMSVPIDYSDDSDMILTELIRRFEFLVFNG